MRGHRTRRSQTAGGDPRREAKERMAVMEAEGAVHASADILPKGVNLWVFIACSRIGTPRRKGTKSH